MSKISVYPTCIDVVMWNAFKIIVQSMSAHVKTWAVIFYQRKSEL